MYILLKKNIYILFYIMSIKLHMNIKKVALVKFVNDINMNLKYTHSV